MLQILMERSSALIGLIITHEFGTVQASFLHLKPSEALIEVTDCGEELTCVL